MIPDFAILIDSFKKVSPTRCKIFIKGEEDNGIFYFCKQIKIQGIDVYKILDDNMTPFILMKKGKQYFMFEENLIEELSINLKEV